MNTHKLIIFTILKKWWLIFLTGLIISAGLACEKAIATNYVIKTGDVWFTKTISMENFQLLSCYDDNEKFKYPSYMKNFKTINTFIDDTEEEFDYKKALAELKAQMFMAAENLEFEQAAELRDRIRMIEKQYLE